MTRGAAGEAGLAATAALTAVALIAFAGNSLLCRAALMVSSTYPPPPAWPVGL